MEATNRSRESFGSLRLLIVDDCEDDATLIVEALQTAGFTVSAHRVASPEAFQAALAQPWDLITCDHAMPGFDAVSAYRLLNASRPEVPFVIVSGCIPETHAFEVMTQGACDYVDKSHLERLIPVVLRELRNRRRLETAYNRDPVTGTANRAEMCRRLRGRRADGVTMLLVGLDRFKKINDAYGHAAGDQVLKAVAERLLDEFGPDAVGRTGDDVFMVLAGTEAPPAQLADRVTRRLSEPFGVAGASINVAASIGSAVGCKTACDLFSCAEDALRRAKRAGRNRHQQSDRQCEAFSAESIALESDLRHALEREQLELFYQVQIHARDHSVVGSEALLRWRHPRFGLVSPGRFIPLAEENGLIVPFGNWVLRTACQNAADGRLERVAVNISALQFHETDLVRDVEAALEETGLAPARLELELTESTLIADPEAAVANLKAIKSLGVHVAIDDFGTGYSSLSYLKRYPLDTLKIDRSFVADLDHDHRSDAIAESLVQLGHRLGLTVLAEGVETEAQAERLREMGCDRLQGFLFGRPEPLAEPTAASMVE